LHKDRCPRRKIHPFPPTSHFISLSQQSIFSQIIQSKNKSFFSIYLSLPNRSSAMCEQDRIFVYLSRTLHQAVLLRKTSLSRVVLLCSLQESISKPHNQKQNPMLCIFDSLFRDSMGLAAFHPFKWSDHCITEPDLRIVNSAGLTGCNKRVP